MINLNTLERFHNDYNAKVSIIGKEDGTLYVTYKYGDSEGLLYDLKLEKVRAFRSPETVTALLHRLGIENYTINLNGWDPEMIYDRHRSKTARIARKESSCAT